MSRADTYHNPARNSIMENPEKEGSQDEQKTRLESFMTEYHELVEKYNCDFITFPQFKQTQEGFLIVGGIQLLDKSTVPVPSNFNDSPETTSESLGN